MRTERGPAALILACLPALTFSCGVRHGPPPSPRSPSGFVLAEGLPPSPAPYAGADACRPCHEGVYRFWSGTAHAGSMASLTPSGERDNPSCLRCHATGFGERSGFGGAEQQGDLGSVSCESCHGPAARHSRNPERASAVLEAGSDCPPCEIQKVCRRCHTLSRSPGFELASGLAAVACRPEPGREDGKDSAASPVGR